jgi:hypothetical protein
MKTRANTFVLRGTRGASIPRGHVVRLMVRRRLELRGYGKMLQRATLSIGGHRSKELSMRSSTSKKTKKRYSSPQLSVHGNVEKLTQGGNVPLGRDPASKSKI